MSADVDGGIAAGRREVRQRRRWSAAEKRRIVEECLEPGVSVSIVARRHDVNANQVFTWRRQLRQQRSGAADGSSVPRIVVAADPVSETPPGAGRPDAGRMDIVLAGGRRVIVEPDVERTALPRVIAVQERRWRPVCRRPVRVPGPAGQPDQEPALAKAGVLWHDGVGLSLYAKRLEQGRFIWPSPADEVVAVTAAQLGYLQEGIDWRNPVRTWRPTRAG